MTWISFTSGTKITVCVCLKLIAHRVKKWGVKPKFFAFALFWENFSEILYAVITDDLFKFLPQRKDNRFSVSCKGRLLQNVYGFMLKVSWFLKP